MIAFPILLSFWLGCIVGATCCQNGMESHSSQINSRPRMQTLTFRRMLQGLDSKLTGMGHTCWASSRNGPVASPLLSRSCMQSLRQLQHGAPAGGQEDPDLLRQILHHCNSKSPTVAAFLCMLYCLSVKFGCLVSATHLLRMDNTWADCLSRGWLEKFYASCPCTAPCLLISVILCLISVMRWIHDLDTCIATWPRSSLTNSMRKAYAARLCHYL